MLKIIRTFLLNRKTKRQINRVIQLLYSDTKFEVEDLITALSPKNNIEHIEYCVIVHVIAKSTKPYGKEQMSEIYAGQTQALKYFIATEEIRQMGLDLLLSQAKTSLMKFNFTMDMYREAYALDPKSFGGLMYEALKVKKNPLTQEEELKLKLQSKK